MLVVLHISRALEASVLRAFGSACVCACAVNVVCTFCFTLPLLKKGVHFELRCDLLLGDL
jgi:hypothetical protein